MKKIIVLFVLLATGLTLKAQSPGDVKNAARLDSIFTAYTANNLFNGTVLVAKKGKVLLKKGYGYASFTYDIPNQPDTKFRLGSVSKQFTAMGIMILEEQKKLSVNDPLSKFIPDYPNGNKITLHHLLNHSSGVPSVTSLSAFDSIKRFPHTAEQLIAYTKQLSLEFEPGQKFNYSNTGYIILSHVIEKASGMSYGDFITKNIFEKLGMTNSGYCHHNAIIKNFAEGYSQTADGYEKPGYIDMSIPLGAGALYSTVEDLYLWDRALYTEKLVKKSTLDKIFAPSADGMGYGWFVDTFGGSKWIYHRGRIEGFSTSMNRFTDEDMCIIILKNVDNQSYFRADKIAMQVMFSEPFELPAIHKAIDVDPVIFKKLTGKYELDSTFSFTVTENEGKLFIQALDEPPFRLLPESEWNYFLVEVNATIEFMKGEKGEIASLVLTQGGQQMPMKRVQ